MAKKMRTVKVFGSRGEQAELAADYELVESYDSFGLFRLSPAELRRLARRHPAEDITDHFEIRIGARKIDTNRPRVDASGKTRSHPAYKGVKPLLIIE